MKSYITLLLVLICSLAAAQELKIDNDNFGNITSVLYKEARITVPITPAEFHQLTIIYEGYKMNFKYDQHYNKCFRAYPALVNWDLSEEELRNLRNYIRRNGGSLPKTLDIIAPSLTEIQPSILLSTKSNNNKDTLVSYVTELPQTTVLNEEQGSTDVSIKVEPEIEDTTSNDLPQELNHPDVIIVNRKLETLATNNMEPLNEARTSRKIDQMKVYKRIGVIYQNDTLSAKEAKLIAMDQSFEAYANFSAAQRIRGWNNFWGIVTVPLYPIVLVTGPAILVRESIRKKRIEQAVEAFNISILKENRADLNQLQR